MIVWVERNIYCATEQLNFLLSLRIFGTCEKSARRDPIFDETGIVGAPINGVEV